MMKIHEGQESIVETKTKGKLPSERTPSRPEEGESEGQAGTAPGQSADAGEDHFFVEGGAAGQNPVVSKHPIIHFPMSSGVNERAVRTNEASSAERAVRSKQASGASKLGNGKTSGPACNHPTHCASLLSFLVEVGEDAGVKLSLSSLDRRRH